jgi:hypothetical protein
VEKLEVEWPHFVLDRKHHRNVDISWGMRLYPDDLDTRSTIDVAGSDSKYTDEHIPDKAVADCFGQRILYRITDSGTSANLIAMADATGFGSSLYGVGSYGGYTGLMNRVSTLPTCNTYGGIPQEAGLRDRLLALPYVTKAAVDTAAAIEFENECLKGFQIKLAALHLRRIPCKAIFFELVLSGNGMRLSPKFCKRLQAICDASSIAMVIDECMTAGRCAFSENSCLLCDSYGLKPLFVTVGKEFGAGLVLVDRQVARKKMGLGVDRRWASTYASRSQVKSVGKAIRIMLVLKDTKATYPKHVEDTVRAKLGATLVVGFGLMLFISDATAIKNPAPRGMRRFLIRFGKKDSQAVDVASLMKTFSTPGDLVGKTTRAFTAAIKQLLLPYSKGSHPSFTFMYALHVYSHTQKPQITKFSRGQDIGASLGAIVRNALSSALVAIETDDLAVLEDMLLSQVKAVRNNVAKPMEQTIFRKVRSPHGRFFIIVPIWWSLLNAGIQFPYWANKYRK